MHNFGIFPRVSFVQYVIPGGNEATYALMNQVFKKASHVFSRIPVRLTLSRKRQKQAIKCVQYIYITGVGDDWESAFDSIDFRTAIQIHGQSYHLMV